MVSHQMHVVYMCTLFKRIDYATLSYVIWSNQETLYTQKCLYTVHLYDIDIVKFQIKCIFYYEAHAYLIKIQSQVETFDKKYLNK